MMTTNKVFKVSGIISVGIIILMIIFKDAKSELYTVLSASLGADIAFGVTSNNQTATNMYNLFKEKLRDARFVDSTEGQNIDSDLGMADVIDASTFINSRY